MDKTQLNLKVPSSLDAMVADNILRLKSTLTLSDAIIADVMKITSTELDDLISVKRKLRIDEVGRLADHFQFSIRALLDGKIDYECIRQHYLNNIDYLPEKYTFQSKSKKRLLKTVAGYLDKHFHWSIKEELLDYFQVKGIANANPDAPMSVYLFEDSLAYLKKRGLADANIYNIGRMSIETSKDTVFHKILSAFSTPEQMFACYFEEMISFIEENNTYQITKLNPLFCEVESREIQELIETHKVDHIAGINRCVYRAGALAAVSQYIGYPESIVTETKCAHRGDEVCRFVIQFRKPVSN